MLSSNQSSARKVGMMGSKGEGDGLGHSQALTVIPEEQSSAFMGREARRRPQRVPGALVALKQGLPEEAKLWWCGITAGYHLVLGGFGRQLQRLALCITASFSQRL